MEAAPTNGTVIGTALYGNAFSTLSEVKYPALQTHISTALECVGEVV